MKKFYKLGPMLDTAGGTFMHFRLNLNYILFNFTEIIILLVAVVVALLSRLTAMVISRLSVKLIIPIPGQA